MLYVGEFAIFKENFVTQPRQVCIQKVIFKIPKFLLTNYSCHAIEYKKQEILKRDCVKVKN